MNNEDMNKIRKIIDEYNRKEDLRIKRLEARLPKVEPLSPQEPQEPAIAGRQSVSLHNIFDEALGQCGGPAGYPYDDYE